MKCCQSIAPYVGQDIQPQMPDDATCQCHEQVDEFQKIVQAINELPEAAKPLQQEIIRSLGALAFFVEANRQLFPKNWKETLTDVVTRIKQIWQQSENRSDSAYKETTYFLHDLVSNIYQTVLISKQRGTDLEEQKVLSQRISQYKTLEDLKKFQRQRGDSIGIGGVHQTFFPIWFSKHFHKTGIKK